MRSTRSQSSSEIFIRSDRVGLDEWNAVVSFDMKGRKEMFKLVGQSPLMTLGRVFGLGQQRRWFDVNGKRVIDGG